MYKVHIIKIMTAELEIEAESVEHAKEIARWGLDKCYITPKHLATLMEVKEPSEE